MDCGCQIHDELKDTEIFYPFWVAVASRKRSLRDILGNTGSVYLRNSMVIKSLFSSCDSHRRGTSNETLPLFSNHVSYDRMLPTRRNFILDDSV